MKALIAGWFTFEWCKVTAGDMMARDVVTAWLDQAGVAYDIAGYRPEEGCDDPRPEDADVVWNEVDPEPYTHLVFVCGPVVNEPPGTTLYERFAHCKKIGIDVSMVQQLDDFNPFDVLIERDSERTARPDLAIAAKRHACPVVGLLLVHPQHEYGDKGRHDEVNQKVKAFLDTQIYSVCPIDTVLEWNPMGYTQIEQVESIIRKMDFVITTRLHGMVLALKNRVPAVAIDAIAGGAKVTAQAQVLNWPWVAAGESLQETWLSEACRACAAPQISEAVDATLAAASTGIEKTRREFIEAFSDRAH